MIWIYVVVAILSVTLGVAAGWFLRGFSIFPSGTLNIVSFPDGTEDLLLSLSISVDKLKEEQAVIFVVNHSRR